MAVSRSMWMKGMYEDFGKMRNNARVERDDGTKEITRKWKEGFASLKAENDRLQMEVKARYQAEMAEIDAMWKTQLAQGPPTD